MQNVPEGFKNSNNLYIIGYMFVSLCVKKTVKLVEHSSVLMRHQQKHRHSTPSVLLSCQVASLLDKLHSTRQHLHQMWHVRKLKLDQCFQLRLFEQDAEKVSRNLRLVSVYEWELSARYGEKSNFTVMAAWGGDRGVWTNVPKKGSLTHADLFCSCCCLTVNGPRWRLLVCLTALFRHPVGFYCEGDEVHRERVNVSRHEWTCWSWQTVFGASLFMPPCLPRHNIDLRRLTPKIHPEAKK